MDTTRTSKKNQGKSAGVPLCIWSGTGFVSTRSCTRRLECQRCQFDQDMTDFFVDNLKWIPLVPKAA